jgi:arsenate reductase
MTAHWGLVDPAAFPGPEEEQRRLFRRVYAELARRIDLFTRLPIESLDRPRLQARLEEIGKAESAASELR